MKKLLSIGLAAMLAFGLATTSFAATDDAAAEPTVTIKKTYQVVNAGTTAPAETFTFTVVPGDVTDAATGVTADNMPMIGTKGTDADEKTIYTAEVSFGDITTDTTIPFTVALPECDKTAAVGADGRYAAYPSVGVYTYYLTEVDNGTAGVTYDVNKPTTAGVDQRIKVVVTVEQDTTGLIRVVGVHAERPYKTGDKKTDEIVNMYQAGELDVSKTVEGNMGNKDKYFKFTVTLNAPVNKEVKSAIGVGKTSYPSNPTSITVGTATDFYLKNGETLSFTNVPYGVTYTVTEANEDYTTTVNGTAGVEVTGTIEHETTTAAYVNTKTGEVDTGVVLNNMPYILVLAVLAAGVAVYIIRKRRED